MADTLIESVSDTAFWIAHHRALETEREDALFRDPLAGVLAGDHGKQIANTMPMPFMTGWVVVIRTCIIDDYIRFAIGQGVDTILNLGAGLDTRPYRMTLPESLLWVEVDYPHVMEFKTKKLAAERPGCRLERVRLDLANLEERRKFFDEIGERAKKILVLTEGVISYLNSEEVSSLAADIRRVDHVGFWVVDYLAPRVAEWRRRGGMQKRLKNAPFRFMPKDWFTFFRERGWSVKETRYLAEEGDRLKRPMRLPAVWTLILKIRGMFMSKKRKNAFRRFAAYVLLEPTPLRQE